MPTTDQRHRAAEVLLGEEGAIVRRETREGAVEVRLDRRRWIEPHLDTGLAFLNHMLEMIAWHGGFTLEVRFTSRRFPLRHVVCEDVGLALGLAAGALLASAVDDGVEGASAAWRAMDEALAFCALSFEGRAIHRIERPAPGAQLEQVEDLTAADMVAFYEGVAQGARCTLHLQLAAGADPHHTWEAAARAFAVALRGALAPAPWRAGLTVGVKGTLD
jgi:imidazoleglycerol-phosphate dehydratase